MIFLKREVFFYLTKSVFCTVCHSVMYTSAAKPFSLHRTAASFAKFVLISGYS